MNYKSLADLGQDIKSNLHKIPQDVSLVVGIPRSGLLAANLLSLYLNRPLTDIDSFLKGNIVSHGYCGNANAEDAFKGRILIIDDSIYSGDALAEAKEKINLLLGNKTYNISYCCIYVYPGKEMLVDIPLITLDMPRVFEWNLFHHSVLHKSCIEIDGVMCQYPEVDINSNETLFLQQMEQAFPLFLPKVRIKTILTARLEKYREITEIWLQQHGISYQELVMAPNKTTGLAATVDFKIKEFSKRKGDILLIDSNQERARKIATLTGRSAYCVATSEMFTNYTLMKKARLKFRQIKKTALSAVAGLW